MHSDIYSSIYKSSCSSFAHSYFADSKSCYSSWRLHERTMPRLYRRHQCARGHGSPTKWSAYRRRQVEIDIGVIH